MNWRTIKNFGQVKYFNVSYAVIIIVPLVANTFEMLNNKFGHEFLFIPCKIKSLYFASILYAIAIAIYQYRCPSIIKEYVNRQGFIDENLEQFKNIAPDLKFYIVVAHLDANTQAATYNEIIALNAQISTTLDAVEKTKLKVQLDEKLNLVYSSSVQSHLGKKYDEANKKERFSIWASGILYLVATLIIVVLLIIRTAIVFRN